MDRAAGVVSSDYLTFRVEPSCGRGRAMVAGPGIDDGWLRLLPGVRFGQRGLMAPESPPQGPARRARRESFRRSEATIRR